MALLIQDSFTAANGTVLSSHTSESGATYARHPSFTVATITIEDNRGAKDTDIATAVYYVNNITDPKFFEVEFTIIDKSDVNRSTGIEVGIDTGSDTAIIYRRQNATTWQLLTIIASTPSATLLSASETFSAEASHTLKLRRIPETNDYECFLDNVSLGVVTISDAEFLGAGKIGFRATNSQGAGVGYHLDNLSVNSLSAPRALHRGRNFPLFDDEEVNRFEFWPAIAVAMAHERAASLNATADIASSGEFFSVFERAASIDATSAVETVGQRVVERSAILDATALISTSGQFFSIPERSAAFDAAASVTVSGARVVDRSTSVESTASIETSGESFSVFESSVSLSATAIIESSGISFSVSESAVSISTAASIEVAGVRIVERSISFSTTATIEASAEFFSVFERQVSFDTTATATISGQTEQQRQVLIGAIADISVSGVVVPPGIVEHERSVAIDVNAAIETAGISFSVFEASSTFLANATITVSALTIRERSALVTADVVVSITGQRELLRTVSLSAISAIEASGSIAGAGTFERSVALNATAVITVNGAVPQPTPPRRTFVVESQRRTYTVPRSNRVYVVPESDRVEVA